MAAEKKGKEDNSRIEGEEVVNVLRNHMEDMIARAPPAKKARKSSCSLGNAIDVKAISSMVMRGMRIHIAGKSHRILEVELYLTGPGHMDPYTHCQPIQVREVCYRQLATLI